MKYSVLYLPKKEYFDKTCGTGLQGEIIVNYEDLVKCFGEPNTYRKDKIDVEWLVQFPDGRFCTIYNYKDGKAYLGEEGQDVEDIKNWHIGGFKESIWEEKTLVEIIIQILKEKGIEVEDRRNI